MDKHQQLTTALKRLLQAKERTPGTFVRMSQQFMMMAIDVVKPVIAAEPLLLRLTAPYHVIGDIHGQFYDLLRIFDQLGTPKDTKYLFLGDYVDKGDQNIETIMILIIYKILHPENIYLLRGNHEISEVNEIHGFKQECITRYSNRLWLAFNDLFSYFPLAAIINDKIFAVHGGISPEMDDIQMLDTIERPIPIPAGMILDFILSEPDPFTLKWNKNPKGQSYVYGSKQANSFLEKNQLDVIVRSHQMVDEGFEFPFEPDRSVVTVYSAPYNPAIGTKNSGAVLNIDDELQCTFTEIKPIERRPGRASMNKSALDTILHSSGVLRQSLRI